jgi:hypothetical protein
MNWVDVIKDIYRTLDANGLHDVSFEIGEEHVKGGTPGEMFTFLVVKLKSIKEDRPEVYALIKEETEWMIAYARKINYL